MNAQLPLYICGISLVIAGGFSWGSKLTMALLVSFVVFVLAAAHGAVGQPGYHPFSFFLPCS